MKDEGEAFVDDVDYRGEGEDESFFFFHPSLLSH